MIRRILRPLTIVACFFLLSQTSQLLTAQVTIVGYDTTNPNGSGGAPSPDLSAVEFVGDVNPLLFSRGPGLSPNQGITLNSSSWSTSSTFNPNSNDYLQWGWSAGAGRYDLTNMTLQYDRSDSGPTQAVIQVSVDSGGFQTIFSDSSVFVGDETHTIDLDSFTNVSSAMFRLFGFDAASTGGTFDIERFTVDPDPSRGIVVRGVAVTMVPEPGSCLVIGCAGLLVTLRRRRVA
jgi:hypothetical protein